MAKQVHGIDHTYPKKLFIAISYLYIFSWASNIFLIEMKYNIVISVYALLPIVFFVYSSSIVSVFIMIDFGYDLFIK